MKFIGSLFSTMTVLPSFLIITLSLGNTFWSSSLTAATLILLKCICKLIQTELIFPFLRIAR